MPYVYAQARHESNDFKSRVYLDNHNYFGMKWIDGRRGQVAKKGLLSPDGNFYAHYETDSSSILDLLKWFDYKNFPVSVKDANQYASELKNRNYYGDSVANYERALKFWINKS